MYALWENLEGPNRTRRQSGSVCVRSFPHRALCKFNGSATRTCTLTKPNDIGRRKAADVIVGRRRSTPIRACSADTSREKAARTAAIPQAPSSHPHFRHPLDYKHPKDGFFIVPFVVNAFLTVVAICLVILLLGLPYFAVRWRRKVFLLQMYATHINVNDRQFADIYKECARIRASLGIDTDIPIFLVQKSDVEVTYLLQIRPSEAAGDDGVSKFFAFVDTLCCRRFGTFPMLLLSTGALQMHEEAAEQFRFLLSHCYAQIALTKAYYVYQTKAMEMSRTLSCDRIALQLGKESDQPLKDAEAAICRVEIGNRYHGRIDWDVQLHIESFRIRGLAGWVATRSLLSLGERIVELREFARSTT